MGFIEAVLTKAHIAFTAELSTPRMFDVDRMRAGWTGWDRTPTETCVPLSCVFHVCKYIHICIYIYTCICIAPGAGRG